MLLEDVEGYKWEAKIELDGYKEQVIDFESFVLDSGIMYG